MSKTPYRRYAQLLQRTVPLEVQVGLLHAVSKGVFDQHTGTNQGTCDSRHQGVEQLLGFTVR